MKIRLLDGFCGAGGTARGYFNAAKKLGVELEIVGVDHRPQRHYLNSGATQFIEADFFDVVQDKSFMRTFQAVHTSPPCQFWSQTRHLGRHNTSGKVDALSPTYEWMLRYGEIPWVIENVEKAPLDPAIMLCGSMFGLTGNDPRRQLRRHRKFFLNGFQVEQPACKHNCFRPLGVYGVAGDRIPGGGETARDLLEARKLMGIDWMSWREIREAIPPAYTEYIGSALLEGLAA